MNMKTKCIGCALREGGLKRLGKKVFETKNFDVEQDFETPIPGFMIISSIKHLKSIEDFSESQRKEFIELLFQTRRALTKILKVKYVYIIQKEDTIIARSHFHFWLFPRYAWMNKFDDKIASVTDIIKYARENLNKPKNLQAVKEASLKINEYLMRVNL